MADITAEWLAEKTEELLKRSELEVLDMAEKGLRQLREQAGGIYTPGLLLAEEFLQKMRKAQP